VPMVEKDTIEAVAAAAAERAAAEEAAAWLAAEEAVSMTELDAAKAIEEALAATAILPAVPPLIATLDPSVSQPNSTEKKLVEQPTTMEPAKVSPIVQMHTADIRDAPQGDHQEMQELENADQASSERRARLEELKANRAARHKDPDFDLGAADELEGGSRRAKLAEIRSRREARVLEESATMQDKAIPSDIAHSSSATAVQFSSLPMTAPAQSAPPTTSPARHSASPRVVRLQAEADQMQVTVAKTAGTSYADFFKAQRAGIATNSSTCDDIAAIPSIGGHPSVSDAEAAALASFGLPVPSAAEQDRRSRMDRIQELRRARGAAPMADVLPDEFVEAATPSWHDCSKEACETDAVGLVESDAVFSPKAGKCCRDVWLPADNKEHASPMGEDIIHFKKIIEINTSSMTEEVSQRDLSQTFEPEPEAEHTTEPAASNLSKDTRPLLDQQGHLQLSARSRSSSQELKASPEAVQDLKLRWKRYSSSEDTASRAKSCVLSLGNGDVSESSPLAAEFAGASDADVFQGLQQKWRSMRGEAPQGPLGTVAPQLKALVAPLELQVKFGLDVGPLCSPFVNPEETEESIARNAVRKPAFRKGISGSLPPRLPEKNQQNRIELSPRKKASAVVPLPMLPGKASLGGAMSQDLQTGALSKSARRDRERENCVHQ